jgi:hypothetical protein
VPGNRTVQKPVRIAILKLRFISLSMVPDPTFPGATGFGTASFGDLVDESVKYRYVDLVSHFAGGNDRCDRPWISR